MNTTKPIYAVITFAALALGVGIASAEDRCGNGDYNCLFVATGQSQIPATRCFTVPAPVSKTVQTQIYETRRVLPVAPMEVLEVKAPMLDNGVILEWSDELKAKLEAERAALEKARTAAYAKYAEIERLRSEIKQVQKQRESLRKTLNYLAKDLR